MGDDAKKDEKPKDEKPKEDKPKEKAPEPAKPAASPAPPAPEKSAAPAPPAAKPEPPAPKPAEPAPKPAEPVPAPAPAPPVPAPRDSFDDAFGRAPGAAAAVFPGELDRGYEEINDYDREAERADSVRYDDDSWPDYQEPFFEMEQASMHTPLREKELMGQVSERALGEEIRHAVEGQAGIQTGLDRRDLDLNIAGARVGWSGVRFGRRPHKPVAKEEVKKEEPKVEEETVFW